MLLTNIATLFVGFGMFGSFLLIPQLAELPESTGFGFGLGATGAGLLLLPGALVMLFAGPISGALGTRFGSKLPLALGAAITSAGLVGLGLDHGSEATVSLWAFVMSTGIGLAFAAMANLIVEAVPPAQTGEATGINTLDAVGRRGDRLAGQRRDPGRQRDRRERRPDGRRLHRRVPRVAPPSPRSPPASRW